MSAARFSGEGTAVDVVLTSNGGKEEFNFGNVPLTARSGTVARAKTGNGAPRPEGNPSAPNLQIGPLTLALGAATPTIAAGWVSASGYGFSLLGDTDVNRVYRLANALAVAGFRPVAEGSAHLDVGISGNWQGFAPPEVTGTAQLRHVRAGMRGLNPPIDIASALLKLEPDAASLEKLSAQTGDTRWTGTVKAPRHCASDRCEVQFDLEADHLSSNEMVEWFTPHPVQRPWYRILAASEPSGQSPLLGIRAAGQLRVKRLSLKKIEATQIVAQVDLDRGKIAFHQLRGQTLQGTYRGDCMIDASTIPLRYQASGALQNVSLAQVGAAMNDSWATGTVDGKFSLTTSGNSLPELLEHAEGDLQFALRNGVLTHVDLPDAPRPFAVHSFTGSLAVKSRVWRLSDGKLESHDGLYQASGTATPGSGLNIRLTRGDEQTWNVTGTLLKPIAARTSRTEARTVKP